MSSSVGTAAEVGTGNIWIIAIPSNIILSTSLTKRFVAHSGQDEPMKSFYNPVTRNKVKTMSDVKTTVRCKTKDIPMNGEEMYLRLFAINAYKKVPPEQVLTFENSASQFIL